MIENVEGFDWDAGNAGKCEKHGLTVAVIEEVFPASCIFSMTVSTQNMKIDSSPSAERLTVEESLLGLPFDPERQDF